VPTPVLYYAAARDGTDGGLQITGSHNPPEYNGFKMIARGRSLYGEAIQALRERIETGASRRARAATRARHHRDYIEDVGGRFRLERPISVVVDCGNGTGSVVAVDLLRRAGADVIPLYCESDGTFPNHHPDPTVDEYIGHDRAGARERARTWASRSMATPTGSVRWTRTARSCAATSCCCCSRWTRWSGWARRRSWSST
jgi:phosphomannomutase